MEALRFNGTGSEYFKIWIVNILLTIITLGIYYPWAKVRNRRYFYANSTLADRNFEYHATGKQLLLGFIIGVILFAIYTFVTQVAPQYALGFMAFFMLLLPWLIWRSLMFNMKVSSFSNVHFSFRGALKTSYKIFLGYPLLILLIIAGTGILASVVIPPLESQEIDPTIITIIGIIVGIIMMALYLYAIVLIQKKSKEYMIGNSFYGQGAFSTNLETKKFLAIYGKGVGLALIPLVVMIGGLTLGDENSLEAEILFIVGYVGLIVVSLLAGAYIMSRTRAYVYKNTLLDDRVAFKSTLGARALAWVMFTNFLMILVTIGFAMPWAKVRMAKLMLENTLVDTSIGFDEYITQQQQSGGAIGEQIGEAFDVDMDVGF